MTFGSCYNPIFSEELLKIENVAAKISGMVIPGGVDLFKQEPTEIRKFWLFDACFPVFLGQIAGEHD